MDISFKFWPSCIEFYYFPELFPSRITLTLAQIKGSTFWPEHSGQYLIKIDDIKLRGSAPLLHPNIYNVRGSHIDLRRGGRLTLSHLSLLIKPPLTVMALLIRLNQYHRPVPCWREERCSLWNKPIILQSHHTALTRLSGRPVWQHYPHSHLPTLHSSPARRG